MAAIAVPIYPTMFVYILPAEVEDVFKLGSMKPGAMLHDANREYEVTLRFIGLNTRQL